MGCSLGSADPLFFIKDRGFGREAPLYLARGRDLGSADLSHVTKDHGPGSEDRLYYCSKDDRGPESSKSLYSILIWFALVLGARTHYVFRMVATLGGSEDS